MRRFTVVCRGCSRERPAPVIAWAMVVGISSRPISAQSPPIANQCAKTRGVIRMGLPLRDDEVFGGLVQQGAVDRKEDRPSAVRVLNDLVPGLPGHVAGAD